MFSVTKNMTDDLPTGANGECGCPRGGDGKAARRYLYPRWDGW